MLLPDQARDLADKALASFVIIQAALRRSRRLHAYTLREDLNRRMPGFTVAPCSEFPLEVLEALHTLSFSQRTALT